MASLCPNVDAPVAPLDPAIAKQQQKFAKKKEALAKRILARAQCDFNTHFQKLHMFKLPKGHWQSFLKAVNAELEEDLKCVVCQKMLVDFKIPENREAVAAEDRAADRARAQPPAMPIANHVNPEQSENQPEPAENELEDALALMMDEEDQPKKRSRPGRPRRGEVAAFNVLEFIDAERPGMYKRLSREEAGWMMEYDG